MATTKKNRTLLNAIMVVLAVVIVAAGVAFVVSIQGGQAHKSAFTVTEITGNANIERAGINYALEKGTALQENDVVETLNGSEAAVAGGGATSLHIADASRVGVRGSADGKADASLELLNGCVFAKAENADAQLVFETAGTTWTASDAIFVLDNRPGTVMVQVLSGSVGRPDGVSVKEGEAYTLFTGQQEGSTSSESSRSSFGDNATSSDGAVKLSLSSLDSFALEHALEAAKSGSALVFTEKDITAELDRREAERLQVADQVVEAGNASGETQAAPSGEDAASHGETAGAEGDGSTPSEGEATAGAPDSDAQAVAADAKEAENPGDNAVEQQDYVYRCTIQIRCDTILDNMDQLAKGKSKYVPKNGVLLKSTAVEFEEGETAFDVLQRTCKDEGIALEYSYVPIYGSYYVEGIGNLYEFDCGEESGWMFKVNGWFPNYGCSQYQLSDGDAVVFCYTCKGLGDDVGA